MIFSGGPNGVESSSTMDFGRTFNPLKHFNNFSYTIEQNSFTEKSLNEAIIDGICQLTINGGNWDLKILKNCSFLLNKKLKATIFMIGGGGKGKTSNAWDESTSDYGAQAGAGGNSGYPKVLENKTLPLAKNIQVIIGDGGNSQNGNGKSTKLIINTTDPETIETYGGEGGGMSFNTSDRTYNTDILTSKENGKGGRGQAPHSNISSTKGQPGFSFHNNFYGGGGGGGGSCSIHNPNPATNGQDMWNWHGSSGKDGGAGGGGNGGQSNINDWQNNRSPSPGTTNTGSGGGGGYCYDTTHVAGGDGGSGIIIISNYSSDFNYIEEE